MSKVTIEIFKREQGKPVSKVIGTFDAKDGNYKSNDGIDVEIQFPSREKTNNRNIIVVKSLAFRGSSGKEKREINLNKAGSRGEIQISDTRCLRVRISQ